MAKMAKVYTVTLAPAIDYILEIPRLEINKTNRPLKTDMYAAGKGIHISMMLNQLNIKNEAIIFTNGYFQNYFLDNLKSNQINFKNFDSKGEIRINLKLIDDHQTELSVKGSEINQDEINKLCDYLENNLQKDDFLVLTGSIPENISDQIYYSLTNIGNKKQAKVVIDSFGSPLLNGLQAKPWLIKPNIHELELTFNRKFSSLSNIKTIGDLLLQQGAENVLISCGAKGATFINRDLFLNQNIAKVDNYALINSAGAGDSMVAGFISEYIKTSNYQSSLQKAVICGTATAYSLRIADREMIEAISPFFDKEY